MSTDKYPVPPSTYSVPAPGYNCAQCATVASSYSNAPLTQCWQSCKDVQPAVRGCIFGAIRQNAYVQAEDIPCVNKTAKDVMPRQECNTLCLATYANCLDVTKNQCVNELRDCQSKCK
jgi:hypothetical protein